MRIGKAAGTPRGNAASPVDIASGILLAAVRVDVAGTMEVYVGSYAALQVDAIHPGSFVTAVLNNLAAGNARADAASVVATGCVLVATLRVAEAITSDVRAALPLGIAGHSETTATVKIVLATGVPEGETANAVAVARCGLVAAI